MDVITILGISFPVLILLAVAVMVVVSILRLRKRRLQFQSYATAHGFSFVTRERLPADLRDTPYFRRGLQLNFGRRIKNVMRRHKSGAETIVFDYWFMESTGVALRTNQTTRATVVCVREGKSGSWHVFHRDGLQYIGLSQLDSFIGESLKELRAHKLGFPA